ncbi:MAG: hypothetical protein H6948_01185 [Zoogloeaceae bacterium]|nr:hypothetical protein [Zoogloeaceae bacterium]
MRITAPQCLAITMLARLLPEFQQRWPRVQLEVSVTGRMTDLVADGLDLGLRIGELADSSLLARRIGSAPFIVCASPRYWSRHGRPEHPRQLIDHNCLIYLEMANHDQWAFEQPDGTAIRIPVSGNLRSDDASLLMRSAIADQGVMIGPQFMFAAAMVAGQLEAVLHAYCRRGIGVYAVYPNSKRVAPKVRAFIDFLAASPEW